VLSSRNTPLPRPFGAFVLHEELGSGAMANVYRATPQEGGPDVALKVLRRHRTFDPRSLERFRREGEILAALDHAGILGVHSAGEVDGQPYLACRLVHPVRTLDEAFVTLDRRGRIEAVRDVAVAVGYAHSKGVLHRDLKPENVLVSAGKTLVADFGLAAVHGAEQLTQTGTLAGTPLYMAPEQLTCERERYGPHTDVWALGVILYEALSARLPYEGESYLQLVNMVQTPPPPPPGAPPALTRACLRALSAEPSDRQQTATVLADELTAWLDGRSVEPRRPGVFVGMFVVGAVVAAGLAFGPEEPRPPPKPPPPPVVAPPAPVPEHPRIALLDDALAAAIANKRDLGKLLLRLRPKDADAPLAGGQELVAAVVANLLAALEGDRWTQAEAGLLEDLAHTEIQGDVADVDTLLDRLLWLWRIQKNIGEETYVAAMVALVQLGAVPMKEHVIHLRDESLAGQSTWTRFLYRLARTLTARDDDRSEAAADLAQGLWESEPPLTRRARAHIWAVIDGGEGTAAARVARLREAEALDPESPWVQLTLAEALAELGSLAAALSAGEAAERIFAQTQYMSRCLRTGSTHVREVTKLGAVYARCGDVNRARALLTGFEVKSTWEQDQIAKALAALE
jgi:tRNA A-37 threonylcarbamoyl transferase component Bud32